jgi:hypothetical protein
MSFPDAQGSGGVAPLPVIPATTGEPRGSTETGRCASGSSTHSGGGWHDLASQGAEQPAGMPIGKILVKSARGQDQNWPLAIR